MIIRIINADGGESITGDDEHNSIFSGDVGRDWIWAFGEADMIGAAGGDDVIDAGDGNDVVDAGAGNDIVFGGVGADWIFGGAGVDWLEGGAGDDVISATSHDGPDTLVGGDGIDILTIGAGGGSLVGGAGDDWLVAGDAAWPYLSARVSMNGGAGRDVYLTSANTDAYLLDLEGDNIAVFGVGTALFGSGSDWIELRGEAGGYLSAGAGADVIFGGGGSDLIFDGPGDDYVNGREGADGIYAAPGVDVIDMTPGLAHTVMTSGRFPIPVQVSDAKILRYDDAAAVAAGNLDIVYNFRGLSPDVPGYGGTPIFDKVEYSFLLGYTVQWYNDAAGDLLMFNEHGIFAKFIGVPASVMNDSFFYV